MFDSFTDDARTVVADSQEQATSLGHNYVGTEHLLFALIAAETDEGPLRSRGVSVDAAVGVAAERGGWTSDADALRALGIDPAGVTAAARAKLGTDVRVHGLPGTEPSTQPPTGGLPFTPRTKTVLELAAAAAGGEPVTPGHILLGMIQEDGGLGVIVLDRLGVDLDRLQAELHSAG